MFAKLKERFQGIRISRLLPCAAVAAVFISVDGNYLHRYKIILSFHLDFLRIALYSSYNHIFMPDQNMFPAPPR